VEATVDAVDAYNKIGGPIAWLGKRDLQTREEIAYQKACYGAVGLIRNTYLVSF
jgi:hypothetical protein